MLLAHVSLYVHYLVWPMDVLGLAPGGVRDYQDGDGSRLPRGLFWSLQDPMGDVTDTYTMAPCFHMKKPVWNGGVVVSAVAS